jgi:hypothetical protein
MTDRSERTNFARDVARMAADWRRDGIDFADMRRSPALEIQYAGMLDALPRPRHTPRTEIEPLEGGIEMRLTSRIDAAQSHIRCFLDGAQRTLRVGRIGVAPLFVAVSTAAILERDAAGNCSIRPGTLRLAKAWLIPRLPDAPELDAAISRIEHDGGRVIDTLAGDENGDRELAEPADYARLEERAVAAAKRVREELEHALLVEWDSGLVGPHGDEWLVVDGRLEFGVAQAVGLVKNVTETHLAGADAELLLGLPARYRTTAFHPVDQRRAATTLWYLRLHDPTGRDARHGLVRLEAHSDVQRTEAIDAISSWVLAERTPRATSDDRWAVLLYPIHLLERALKRQIEGECRGWPAS